VDLHERVKLLGSVADLADFIAELNNNLLQNRDGWESPTLERYLEAMEAWLRDASSPTLAPERRLSAEPSWQTMAKVLYAATMYE